MEKLPHEISENILFRLPSKSSLHARRVCKTWSNLLANRRYNGFLFAYRSANNEIQHYFGDQYDHIDVDKMNYYYSYEELIKLKPASLGRDLYKNGWCKLVGSCNGLICLKIYNPYVIDDSFLICNPLTGEVVLLPSTRLLDHKPIESPSFEDLKAYGFGYCESTNEYKVVIMYNIRHKAAYAQVCTIGSGWRNVVSIPDKLCATAGIFVNGALHWYDCADELECKTVAFDIEDEKFRSLPKPPAEVQFRGFGYILRMLGGNLCLVSISFAKHHINIWAYKKINGSACCDMKWHDQKGDYYNQNTWNWIKEFSLMGDVPESCVPFAITKSNQVLLCCKRKILYSYDPGNSTLNKLWDDEGMGDSYVMTEIPHRSSLVTLKGLVKTGKGDYKYYNTCDSLTTKDCIGRCKNSSANNDKHYKNLDMERKKLLPPDEQRCCVTASGGWRCKNIKMSHGVAKSKRCEKHYNYYAMKLPPDEQRCSQTNGRGRCRNFRMGAKTRYCEKHYILGKDKEAAASR